MPSRKGGSFEARWEIGYLSTVIKIFKESPSYRSDVGGVEASLGQTRQGALLVEAIKKHGSYVCDLTRIETSCWKLSQ